MTEVILLVEDSQNDEHFFKLVMQKVGVRNPIITVRDGALALAYFQGMGEYADRTKFPLPRFLFVDIIMPGADGYAVLEWLRTRPDLKKGILVVVLTQFGDPGGIRRAYEMGADSFVPKPLSESDAAGLIRHFKDHWVLENHAE